MKRLFLAVDLAISVVEQLAVLQEEMQSYIQSELPETRVRWVDAANIHLTLKFLGATDEPLIPMLTETMEELVKPLFPFEVECRSLGCFPKPQKPRILWTGLDPKSSEVLSLLQQAIERDLEELGFPADPRPFRPHITLGRVKSREAPDMTPAVERFADTRFGQSYIKDIALFESVLHPSGPEYRVLNRFTLGNP